MCIFVSNRVSALMLLALLSLASHACQQAANTNTTATNTTTTTNVNSNTTVTTTTTTGVAPDTREPEKYRATVMLKLEATGQQTVSTPPITATFARNGADRRLSFMLPGGEEVVYVDRADKRLVILPKRRQYAELTREATGFEVPSMMTPGQIVNQLKSSTKYQLVGDDQWNGRPVTKYRFAGTTQTGTQAGEVKTEAFLYVDKETGLPIRSETVAQSSGNVQGVSNAKLIQEITNVEQNVDPQIFEVPQGYSKVDPEQIKQQVNLVAQAIGAIAQQVMQAAATQPGSANTNTQPATSPTPASTPVR